MDCDYTFPELVEREFGPDHELTIRDLPKLWEQALISWSHIWEIFHNRTRDEKLRIDDNMELYRSQQRRVVDSYEKWFKLTMFVRKKYQQAVLADPELLKQENDRCAKDIIHWARVWCTMVEPRMASFQNSKAEPMSPIIPFIPYAGQERMILTFKRSIVEGFQTTTAKSREAGISWAAVLVTVHGWRYTGNYYGTLTSEKEAKVDAGKSRGPLLGKCRHIIYDLPSEMRPDGYKDKLDKKSGQMVSGEVGNPHDNFMRIINPANNSEITGECGENIGEGNRYNSIFNDEYQNLTAKMAANLDRAMESVSFSRGDIGTPKGMNHLYHRFTSGGSVPCSIHWAEDPRKVGADYVTYDKSTGGYDKPFPLEHPWRKFKEYTLEPHILASSYDISFKDSISDNLIKAEWIQAAVDYKPVEDLTKPIRAGLDIAGDGDDSTVLGVGRNNDLQKIQTIDEHDVTLNLLKAHDLMVEEGVAHVNFDKSTIGQFIKTAVIEMRGVPPYTMRGITGNSNVPDVLLPSGDRAPEILGNLRSYLWHHLRDLFKNTYEHANGLAKCHPHEMISLPEDSTELQEQLLGPRALQKARGLWYIESKQELKARGIKSPDEADMLAYWAAPDEGGLVQNLNTAAGNHLEKISPFDNNDAVGVEYVLGYFRGASSTGSVLIRWNARRGKVEIVSEMIDSDSAIKSHLSKHKVWDNSKKTTKFVVSEEIFKDLDKGNFHGYQRFKDAGVKPMYNDAENLLDELVGLDELFGADVLLINTACVKTLASIQNADLKGKKLDQRQTLLMAALLAIQFVRCRKAQVRKRVRAYKQYKIDGSGSSSVASMLRRG